jgi:peptidoglycan/LPS O-acetylase OafA/YrhL
MKPRILFLDIIRIAAISMIVIFHLGILWNIPLISTLFPIIKGNSGVIDGMIISLGQLGVYLLIFVSGAALAISHPTDKVFSNLGDFYGQRMLRIYPAFWVSMAIPIIIAPAVLIQNVNWSNVIPVITGFTAFVGEWGGPFYGVYWFIGLIISLYLLYPIISKFIDWNPVVAMIALILITYLSIAAILTFDATTGLNSSNYVIRWCPLSNLAIFGAGIFCIRTGFYPKITSNIAIIPFLAEISFFVFLYFRPIMDIVDFSKLGPIAYPPFLLPLYFVILGGVCLVAMHIDKHIRTSISEKIKEFMH